MGLKSRNGNPSLENSMKVKWELGPESSSEILLSLSQRNLMCPQSGVSPHGMTDVSFVVA